MPSTGYLKLRAYTSTAQYPLKDVAVAVTTPNGTAIAMRITDRNGLIKPIELSVPDRWESLQPDPPEKPYTTVNLYAGKKGYERIEADNIQIFADTITYQNLEMIPLPELPQTLDQTILYNTPPQNL